MFIPTKVMFRPMMMFVRTSEPTETLWSEIDLENESWVIDWHRMKMGKKKVSPRKVNHHHVFLPRQGWELLQELRTVSGGNKYLFSNLRDYEKPATNFGILAALKRMGHGGKMTEPGCARWR
jgi:integrase